MDYDYLFGNGKDYSRYASYWRKTYHPEFTWHEALKNAYDDYLMALLSLDASNKRIFTSQWLKIHPNSSRTKDKESIDRDYKKMKKILKKRRINYEDDYDDGTVDDFDVDFLEEDEDDDNEGEYEFRQDIEEELGDKLHDCLVDKNDLNIK
jgi:hypothetical protein